MRQQSRNEVEVHTINRCGGGGLGMRLAELR